MFKPLNIIVCCDANYGIGIDNKLPWNISSEMKIFKDKTIGGGNNCVLMGKNTYLSIPEKYRPLKTRFNCIISKSLNEDSDSDTTHIMTDFDNDILNFLNTTSFDTYWIIGGEKIYNNVMKNYHHLVNEIHITKLDHNYDCNKFFPFVRDDFELDDTVRNDIDKYTHCVYKKKKLN